MIRGRNYRVIDIRRGREPVQRLITQDRVVWERGLYLYLGCDRLWLPREPSGADMEVYANTVWHVVTGGTDVVLSVKPTEVTLTEGGRDGEVNVQCCGEWEVEGMEEE